MTYSQAIGACEAGPVEPFDLAARPTQHGMWQFPCCPLAQMEWKRVVEDGDAWARDMAGSDLLQHHPQGHPRLLVDTEHPRNARIPIASGHV